MASTYPGTLDSFDEPSAPSTTALNSAGDSSPARTHNEHHRDLGDAIEAVQTALETNLTGVVTSNDGGVEKVSTVAASGSTETLNLANGNIHDVTLDANCTFTFSGTTASKGCSFTLILRQDGTGSRTVTWPASVDWAGGAAPTLSTPASSVDILTFFTINNGTTWFGALVGKAFA